MGRSYLVSRISYFVIRISHLTLHKIRFTPYAYLTLHATLSRFRHLALHESFPRNHQSKRAALTARFELCLARNSRRGVESRSWNAGLRRELAHAVFNGQTAVAHGQAGLRRSIGSQAISSLVETCRCQVNTESPYASTLNNRKRQETKPACRTLHASSRACANRRQIAAVKPTDAQSVDSRRHGG
jgi:hypothetical protein